MESSKLVKRIMRSNNVRPERGSNNFSADPV